MLEKYTIVKDEEVLKQALTLCKGSYQVDVLLGIQSLSGATLKGKARKWGGKYHRSRLNLLKRLTENEIPWGEKRVKFGKRVLVIG